MKELAFSYVKPGAVRRGQIADVVKFYHEAGFGFVASKRVQLTREQAKEHYHMWRDQEWFDLIVEFMVSGPVQALILVREDGCALITSMAGYADPAKAKPGTIQHALGVTIRDNAVHTSDDPACAWRELSIVFSFRERWQLGLYRPGLQWKRWRAHFSKAHRQDQQVRTSFPTS